MFVRNKNNVAAIAAVAAIWATIWHKFFGSKACFAVAALTSLNKNFYSI
jgi:hypothetical protein